MELRNLRFAVVDTETTGGGVYGGDRIMEVAVIHVDGDRISTAIDQVIDPQRPIGRFVSRPTGITWEMVREAPTFGDVAPMIHDALEDRIFVAQNVRFDCASCPWS